MDARDYEKLGAFYLGKGYDLERGALRDEPILYDAKDLTTHAVCVGMTGSGKTGLCVTLIEEAAIDGIPAIVVDLKGDLVNLLLAFPEMRPEDLAPWIDPAEATRKGMTVADFARDRARLWRDGLARWDQGLDRIARFRDAADFSVYTPGSTNGIPLTILKSFAAPPQAVRDDAEALQGRIAASASGLLGLVGIQADPVTSREHILIASLLQEAWTKGRDLDLGGLIMGIQKPPFGKVGFFDLETFFPAAERLALAMRVNNLLASPGFATWLEGEPIDIARLLWTDAGKPRISIVSLAHLDDAARMFFLTTLLGEINSWMRTQSGSSSLRALLYIDEVFGYLPPGANPPSKTPLLTLLKQARAFGVGLVLATQNPVDLDYKALSNAGTWFIGRLQTERDKLRVLDGLEGAAGSTGAAFDRREMERILSGLDSRVFVMNNVHDDGPVVFHSRWALSFLRGPVSGAQLRELVRSRPAASAPPAAAAVPALVALKGRPKGQEQRDLVPAGVEERFAAATRLPGEGERLVYRPALAATASLHYVQASVAIDCWEDVALLAPLSERTSDDPWEKAVPAPGLELESAGEEGAAFEKLPAAAGQKRSYGSWETALENHLYRERPLVTWRCKAPKLVSKPGEREGDFRARLKAAADEQRDLELEKLRQTYGRKLKTLQDRVDRAEDKVAREESQLSQQKGSTLVAMGSTLLGALFGRKVASIGNVGRAASTLRGAGRVAREKGDVARANEDLSELEAELRGLEAEFAEAVARVQAGVDPTAIAIEEVPIRFRKTDYELKGLALVWTPWIVGAAGIAEPVWRND